mmetsp:Transcript_76146/g.176625  ORF Transcript_76146/g.176625 Transcript_76146/m.176625 type:complete len:556 (-) Transcript_76146:96-1763(-)
MAQAASAAQGPRDHNPSRQCAVSDTRMSALGSMGMSMGGSARPLVNHASNYDTLSIGKAGIVRKRAFPEQKAVRENKMNYLAKCISREDNRSLMSSFSSELPISVKSASQPISNAQIFKRLVLDPINLLLIAAPLGILAEMADFGGAMVFILCFIGLIPLAKLLGDATEHLAENLNETIGGLLNATFGNAVEMIITLSAIRAGHLDIVKQSLLGSILSNLLLVLGMSFFAGGITRFEQSFSGGAAMINITMLFVGIMSFSLPTIFAFGARPGDTLMISRVCALFVAVGYIAYLIFQLYTHAEFFEDQKSDEVEFVSTDGVKISIKANDEGKLNFFENGHLKVINLTTLDAVGRTIEIDGTRTGDWPSSRKATVPAGQDDVVQRATALFARRGSEEDEEMAVLGVPWAVGLLLACTVVVAFLSEYMVDAIDGLVQEWHVPKAFVGVILLPIVGNACEHASAIRMAWSDKVATAIAIAIGSSTQIAIFVMPFAVIAAQVVGQNLDLNLHPTGLAVLFLSVLVVFSIVLDGKSNWLEGFMLALAYCLVATLYWYTPKD